MKKIVRSLGTAFVAVLISACGGGGGDSSPAPAPVVPVVVVTPPPAPVVPPVVVVTPPPVVPVPVVVTVTCPDGSTATSATNCPAVGTGPIQIQGSVMNPVNLDNGITIQFNGALVPSSVTVLMMQGNSVLGSSWTLGGGNKDLTFKPTMRAGYGQTVTVTITATDTLGRPVSVTFSFTTSAMTCSSNAVFSNPVPFSAVYQACVASIGVQVLVTPSLNTMTDTSCTPTVGTALSAVCKAYMANGTVLLADTSIVANNHALMWMAFLSVDGKSNLMLLDTVTLAPIGAMVLPGNLLWIIGNPTGAAIRVNVGGVQKTQQARWGGAAITLN